MISTLIPAALVSFPPLAPFAAFPLLRSRNFPVGIFPVVEIFAKTGPAVHVTSFGTFCLHRFHGFILAEF